MVKPDRRAGDTKRGATQGFRDRGGVLLLASWLLAVPVDAVVSGPVADATLALGAGGWTLEYFGREVAILRASLTRQADGDSGDRTGSVVLSCAGSHRRLTLSLPAGSVGDGTRQGASRASGLLVIRALPRRPDDPFVIASAQPSRTGTFSIAGEAGQDGEPVLTFARLMLGHPSRLDLLMRDRSEAVAFGSLTPLHVLVSWQPGDAIAFRDFQASCASGSPRRP